MARRVHLPSLRERRSDIPLLARHFLHQFARKLSRPVQGIEKESLENLMRYSWPGNVRELQNAIERATILAQGPTLSITDPVFTKAERPNSAAVKMLFAAPTMSGSRCDLMVC